MESCDHIFENSYFEPEENKTGLACEKLLWLVKEEIILLTGGRDRRGCPILSCPSKKETDRYALEDLQRLIGYLLTVPSQDEGKSSFTVLVDMRRCKWETIKPLLKAFDDSNGAQQIHSALVIRPDNFLQKHKANFGSSKLSFETCVISLDSLIKYVDKSQITPNFDGHLKYDHNQWIRLRLNFETFTWQANKFLEKLEKVQERMASVEVAQLTDSDSAWMASGQHERFLQVIQNAPFVSLAQQGMTLEQMLNQLCYSSTFVTNPNSGTRECQLVLTGNPDLASWIPKVHNLVERIQLFRPHLTDIWNSNRLRLDQCHQLRTFEADMVIVFQWLDESRKIFMFTYNQRCDSSHAALILQKNDEAFNQVAKDAFKEIDRLVSLAGHLVSNNHYARQDITHQAQRLERERKVFAGVLAERTRIISLTVKFFTKAEDFINSVPGWTEAILGIDFTMTAPSDLIELKESLNHAFNNIKVFYNEVGQLAKALLELLLQPPPVNEYGNGQSWANDLNYSVCSDPVSAMKTRVLKDFQHLELAYENKLQCITLFIAVEMFEKDVQAVVSWIDDHGEPFICKTTNIGKSLTRTKALVRKHDEFIKIAEMTSRNAQKVVQQGNALLNMKVGDQAKIAKYIDLIQKKMSKFQAKVDYRTNLLQLAYKFYDNMKNINAWIKILKDKLSDNSVPETLELVRKEKKTFETERNATLDAMLDCRNDGEKLREELRHVESDDPKKFSLPDVVNESMVSSESGVGSDVSKPSAEGSRTVSKGSGGQATVDDAGYRAVTELIASLDDHRRDLDELWSNRKFSLDLGEQLRWFEQRCREINENASYWVAQLDEIRRHDNANTVAQMLKNSSEAVHATVSNAKEVLKAGQELYLYVRNINNVQFIDNKLMGVSADEYVKKLWTDLKDNVEALQESDNQQRQHFQLQIEVNNFEDECKEALDWIQTAENTLNRSPVILTCLQDAAKLEDETRHFHGSLQQQHQSILGVYRRAEFILSSMECMNSDTGSNSDDTYQDDFKGNIRINQLAKQIADDWGKLVSRVEYRNDLARTASNFFNTHYSLVETLESLQRDFSYEEDTTPDMPVDVLRDLLTKHSSCKEDFTKLCGYIRKLSENFLAQLFRKVNHEPFSVDRHDDAISRNVVQQKMDSVLKSESNLLAAWDKQKKRLDNHLKVAELKQDCETILKWLKTNREQYVNATNAMISGSQPLTGDQLRLIISQHDSFRQQAKLQKLNVEEIMIRFADLKNSQTPLSDLTPASPFPGNSGALLNDLQKLCKKLYASFKSFQKDTDAICASIFRQLELPPPWERLASLTLDCPAPDTPVGTSVFNSGISTPVSGTPGSEASGATPAVPSTPVIDEKRRLERKREFVINELLETEKLYVRDLALCVTGYLENFRNASNLPGSLMDKRSSIFANIEQIYNFHSETFVKELEGFRGRPEDVGHGFVRNANKFKQLYVEYCKNMPESNRVILMPETSAFFDTIKERHQLSLEIQSCLIKPVQRITKYSLLLKDLLSCCDFQSEIKEALELMRNVPQKANDTMHLSLLQNVPKELNLDLQGDLILQETFQMWEPRQLIKKGRERHLFLFEDFIIFAKIVKDANGQRKYLYKNKFEVRSADFSITDHVDTERKFGLYFSRPYNDSNKYVLRAPTEESKNDWLVALRSAKKPELYLEKNLDVGVGSAGAGATARRSVNVSAGGAVMQQQNSAGSSSSMSQLRSAVSGSTIASSDMSSPLASNNSLPHSNRDSKISRDSQTSTGDEREATSLVSNEYAELTHPGLYSSPYTGVRSSYNPPSSSSAHVYMNCTAPHQSQSVASLDGCNHIYSSPQPLAASYARQHSAGPLGEQCEKVSMASLSSSTGGNPSDRDEQNPDDSGITLQSEAITPVVGTSTTTGASGDNERAMCSKNSGAQEEHMSADNELECQDVLMDPHSLSLSSHFDDSQDGVNANGSSTPVVADTGASSVSAKRSNSIKKWLTSPVRKLSGHNSSQQQQQQQQGMGNKRSPLGAKLSNTPQIQAMYSQHYSSRKTELSLQELNNQSTIVGATTNQNAAPSESVENLSGVLSTCVIQESNEELLSGSAAANGGANVTLSTSQQHPHQHQLMGGEMSANATLERDQGSLSQNQLPPPMPDLSPSAHLTNLTPGPVGMRRTNKASECSPFQAMTLEEITANRPPKEPTTKRECMVFEIADTEAKYVYNLGLIVECYMASTQSSPSTSSATPSIASHAYSGGLSAPILSAQQLTASSSLAAAAVDNSSLVSIPPELADRLHIVWGNIRQIYEWHRNTLLPALDSACYSNNLLDLANCFIKHERRFLMYSKYALNLPKADYILGEFDSFFIDLRKTLGLKQSLKDLLIEPIQRAMRYQLMLQGLVTHLDKHSEQLLTSEENTTHLDRLRHSLKVMTRIPKEVNDMMQLGKLFDYDAKSYGSITAQGKLILQSSIKFYAEGSPNLNASSNKKKDNKKLNSSGGGLLLGRSTSGTELSEFEARHVFLFEQSMLVAEAEKGSGSSNFIGPRYFFKHFIKGSSMNGVVAEGNNNNNSCSSASSNGVTSPTSCGEAGVVQQPQFRLECSDRNYEFVFDSSATCQQWATTITNLIMDRRDFAKALSKPIEFQKKQLLNSSNSSCNSSSSSAAPLISPNCNIP